MSESRLPARDRRRPPSGRVESLLRVLAACAALVLLLVLAAMAAVLVDGALPILSGTQSVEILPPAMGTLESATLALLLSVPLSLGVALFVTEFASERVAKVAAAALDVMGAVPTLVYGMWGLLVLAPWLGSVTPDPGGGALVAEHGGIVPAGFVLAVMLLPSVSNMARKLFSSVPTSLREAAIAVGATRWEVVRFVVFPHVRSGLAGAVVLGLGRATGEAMAVVLVLGNLPLMEGAAPRTSLAAAIVTGFEPGAEASQAHTLALFALCLLALTLAVHAIGRLLVARNTAPGGMA